MNDLSDIKFYSTVPHPCSYLDEQEATTVFMDTDQVVDSALLTLLSQIGFRRSGSYIYRPNCQNCQACIAVRIPVGSFESTRSMRRVKKRNSDMEVKWLASIDDDECFELYRRYIEIRHRDGDMYPPTREQYRQFLIDGVSTAKYVGFRLDGKLVAIAVMDQLEDGFSAVYTFFCPDLSERSLGRYAILWQIEYCQSLDRPFLYLGYWIKSCGKMSYKTQFRPLELYIENQWVPIS
ncbi:MAG: arginyltransferase [Pseudomonadales bacterium]|nr:arginyltransferase [Pseudomonadales bacterium]